MRITASYIASLLRSGCEWIPAGDGFYSPCNMVWCGPNTMAAALEINKGKR